MGTVHPRRQSSMAATKRTKSSSTMVPHVSTPTRTYADDDTSLSSSSRSPPTTPPSTTPPTPSVIVEAKVATPVASSSVPLSPINTDTAYPLTWTTPIAANGHTLIGVTAGSAEYKEVSSLFGTSSGYRITGIERIQHASLWTAFTTRRAELLAEKANVMEVRGFHGSSTTAVNNIAAVNFDLTKCTSLIGRVKKAAVWFGTTASYPINVACSRESSTAKSLIIARMMVSRDPILSPHDSSDAVYESFNFSSQYGGMYMILRTDQIIPEYIIRFTT